MTRILLINGHVASLKTTLGYLLAPALHLGLVTTSVVGRFVPDAAHPDFHRLREERYAVATVLARAFLEQRIPLLLDGTFARRRWREAIYALAAEFGVEEVVALTCVCTSPLVVQQRLAHRRRAQGDAPDAAADTWDAYVGSVRAFEPLDADELPGGAAISRLHFDSATFRIGRERVASPFAEEVAIAVERLVASGRLARPHFGTLSGDRPATELPVKRLIALEGLAGSGKTTQAHALASLLAQRGDRAAVFGEFSEGPMGEYLRGRTAIDGDARVRIGERDPSHTESILVIGDALGNLRRAAEKPPGEVIVADGYSWSHLAHGLALLPQDVPRVLPEQMAAALSEILAPLESVAAERQTVFLRIGLEAAIARVEQRMGRSASAESRRFLIRMHGIYDSLAAAGSAVIVDAEGSRDQVTQRIAAGLGLR